MSTNHTFSGRKKGFYIRFFNRSVLDVVKWSLVALAVASIFLSLSLVVKAANSWAQCFEDSYVECSGGVRCTATDQQGCACYDGAGRKVMSRTCAKDAARDGGFATIEDDF
jgi:hypothetical protein